MVDESFVLPTGKGQLQSPIEDKFFDAIQYHLAPNVEMRFQEWCETPVSSYRLDFFFAAGPKRIGIECDGKDFHNFSSDRKRDREILKTGFVGEIVRFSGSDIFAHEKDCLYVLSQWHPELFTDRAKEVFRRTARERIVQCVEEFGDANNPHGFFCYPHPLPNRRIFAVIRRIAGVDEPTQRDRESRSFDLYFRHIQWEPEQGEED